MEYRLIPAHKTPDASFRLSERAAAIGLLVFLHAALLYLFNPKFGLPKEEGEPAEITLSFSAAKPNVLPLAINPVFVKPNAPALAPPVVPLLNAPSAQQPPLAPDIAGLGRSLFNCDLANGRNLPPEARTNCWKFGARPPTAETMAGLPKNSKAKNGGLWAAELAAREAPAEVPCTSLQQQVFGGVGMQKPVTTLMADPLCLLGGLLNGFRPETK